MSVERDPARFRPLDVPEVALTRAAILMRRAAPAAPWAAALDAIVMKCLAKEPGERFSSADEACRAWSDAIDREGGVGSQPRDGACE